MPCLYEIILKDRKELGLKPYKYSGSNYNDNPNYWGSSGHPDYKNHLEESMQKQMVQKNIIRYFEKEEIKLSELRKIESDWQRKENHKLSDDYYNMCDSIHPSCESEESRKRISKTLKEKGICAYKEGVTNSPEAIAKARETKDRLKYRNFYNPETLETKMIPTGISEIPNGWLSGRKPKKVKIYSDRTKAKNLAEWEVYKNNELIWAGENLSDWCKNTKINLKFKTEGLLILVKEIIVTVKYSIKGTIIENDIDTGLKGKEYSKKIGKSESFVSNSVKNGYFKNKIYDYYKANKIRKV